MPDISIIVPVFNKEEYLGECLSSLCTQTCTDMEILCIDNNSSDNSLSILENAAARDSRIIVLKESQQGVSFARNTGLDHATGEYIGFIDADDFIERDYFERLLEAARKFDAEIALCGFDCYHPFEALYDGDTLPAHAPAFAPANIGSDLFFSTTPSVCTKIFNRSLIKKYGIGFDTSLAMAEDLLFSFCLLAQAREVAVIAEPLYHYRQEVHKGEDLDNKALSGVHVLDAFEKVYQFFIQIEVSDSIKTGLLNSCIDNANFALNLTQSYDAFKEIFLRFKSDWVPRISVHSEEDIAPRMRDVWMSLYHAGCPEELLFEIYLKKSSSLAWYERHATVLEKEHDALQRELDEVKASATYRVGDTLMKGPRKVKELLRP